MSARSPFVYEALPGRVVFGPGRVAEVGEEVARLVGAGCSSCIDENAKAIADDVAAQLGPRLAARWDEVVQHVPVELASGPGRRSTGAAPTPSCAIGGGSATGLAKAIALTTAADRGGAHHLRGQ